MRLTGKVALISGAGGPMGTAVATLFAQEGAKVVLVARREEPLRQLTERIRSFGGDAIFVTADVLTEEGAQRMVQVALEKFGRLDILYNNVGDYAFGERGIDETDESAWRYLLRVNLDSAYLPCRFAVPALRSSGGGVIINVSAAFRVRQQANPGYAAAKAGLIGLTLNLACALKSDNIRVHCLCPGDISQLKSEGYINLPTPTIKRSPEPEDVAYAALFLCSDEAAGLTGIILTIDGGASLEFAGGLL